MTERRYCAFCGRVAHRCQCISESSPIRLFLSKGANELAPQWKAHPYKRGVPPQIKRRERATLRRNYATWYERLIKQFGAICLNCGVSAAEAPLVIDHILPIAKGGLSELENLQLLCHECNRIKGKLYIDCRPKP